VTFHRRSVLGDREKLSEESARRGGTWRILMLEECRLWLFGNSDSEGRGGQGGRRGGGGGIAPDSAGVSVVPVDRDWAAAAHGGITQRCLDVSKVMEMSLGTLAQLAPCFSGREQKDR
jgi:hypothetical protein